VRILADENIEPAVIEWLRAQGHDVVAVRELCKGSKDARVLALAAEESRVLLTSDLGFGDLVFRAKLPVAGVILLRFRTFTRREFLDLFELFWPEIERAAGGHFVVATNLASRARPLPGRES
jgi:predicted nuclease of predicted toxin-antitoxin system